MGGAAIGGGGRFMLGGGRFVPRLGLGSFLGGTRTVEHRGGPRRCTRPGATMTAPRYYSLYSLHPAQLRASDSLTTTLSLILHANATYIRSAVTPLPRTLNRRRVIFSC